MGLRAGLDWCGKSRPTGIRSPDHPARRQSLYRLRYPARDVLYEVKISDLPHFVILFRRIPGMMTENMAKLDLS